MNDKRVILIIVDSFGIGEMDDTKKLRIADIGCNTVRSVTNVSNIKVDAFSKLGLFNICDVNNHPKATNFLVSSSKLKHYGADSYFGHQEMFGTDPIKPIAAPFNDYIKNVEKLLDSLNIKHNRLHTNDKDILVIKDSFTLADNVETDPGQAYNITADLNKIEFSEVLEIAKKIRSILDVPRLIVFGGKDTTIEKIKSCVKYNGTGYVGIDSPLSGVYTDTYQCVHLGHGINIEEQIVKQLYNNDIYPTFIGKVGDIVYNELGKNIAEVDTKTLMELTINEYTNTDVKFIATNIQETDLAGHSQDVDKYASKISIVNDYLNTLIDLLDENTLLVVTADHGNDPLIGHPQHTRENVPILFYPNTNKAEVLPIRESMNDIGSTVVHYLTGEKTINGNTII